MLVTSVKIENIRNIRQCSEQFPAGLIIFHGRNAQGKTNILESLSLLSHARSFRDARNEHLISQGEEFGVVQATILNDDQESVIRIVIQPSSRIAFLNGKRCTKLSELTGYVHFIIFSAADLLVLRGTPAERRQFLDRLLYNLVPGYLPLFREYSRVVQQRNRLLSMIREGKSKAEELEIWNEQLVDRGVEILERRLQTFGRINEILPAMWATLTDVEENVQLCYKSSLCSEVHITEQTTFQIDRMRELFIRRLKESRAREIERGYTLWGPHRDDFTFLQLDRDLRHFGSQGEMRSGLIALKLAEIRLFYHQHGQYPVVLLDDVLSELDDRRAASLLENLDRDQQTFISVTSLDVLQTRLGDAKTFEVSQGMLV